jgi:hypothetical protein
MPPVEFEPTVSVGERPQTHALDRATTGTGVVNNCTIQFNILTYDKYQDNSKVINGDVQKKFVFYVYRRADVTYRLKDGLFTDVTRLRCKPKSVPAKFYYYK